MIDIAQMSKKHVVSCVASAILVVGGTFSLQLFSSQYAWGNDQESTEESYREALEALYHATGGNDWTHNDGWLTDAPLVDWYGLRMSEGRITHLELDDNNLTGELPKEIEMLDVYMLDLRWNSLSGGLENLKNMKAVGELLLSANNFSGRIPRSLGNITSLRRLDLSDNQFTGSIPNRLTQLKKLAAFAAHSNNLPGKIPRKLCDLPDLKRLVLSDNQLTGSVEKALVKCTKLHHLNVANNQLEGNVPEELSSSKSLKWLDLRGNEISAEQQNDFQVNFFGISTQPAHVGELNGLTFWSRDSSISYSDEQMSRTVRALNAISIKEGLIDISDEKVPSTTINQIEVMKEFVNSYLLKSDTRISTIVDLERMLAKSAKHSLTKRLKELEEMANPRGEFRFEAR
ncbi:MAG: hypothetical protein F4219_08960 [Gammaproteobacteria bacterium]|nr:hypothetical protein [Gammaproteobacteria bacterium]